MTIFLRILKNSQNSENAGLWIGFLNLEAQKINESDIDKIVDALQEECMFFLLNIFLQYG